MDVRLEITSWIGLSLGARHWYGELSYGEYPNRQTIKLFDTLTTKQAALLNKEERQPIWERGDQYHGFDSREAVIAEAERVFAERFRAEDKLIINKP